MATRAAIVLTEKDGSTLSIYTHWDGYPGHHLPILKEYYPKEEDVRKLMELGDLSLLDKSTDCPEGHSFSTPVDGYCIAYGRDRGEINTKARKNNIPDGVDYIYTYSISTGKWSYRKTGE